MKVLIIDRDPMFSSLLAGKIRACGHEAIEIPIKNEAIETLETLDVDAIYFDPAPMSDPKAILLQIRRIVRNYPYTVLMMNDINAERAVSFGCNEGLAKPLDPQGLQASLGNAERMIHIVRRIGDETYDFPSSGGVISKSAFNQLFRSALDRVNRYSELAHVLFIGISNYDDIKMDDGKYAADYATSKLAQTLARLRRQSDVLAQTGVSEYAILLQRPQTPTESMDAARRFAGALERAHDITSNGVTDLKIDVRLIHLPNGALDFAHESVIRAQGAQMAG